MAEESRGEQDGFWTEKLVIHSYDVDIGRKLAIESLLQFFQEAAWNHAELLQLGYSHLRSRNQVWVLSRMKVLVHSYPEWGQEVTLRTWACGSKSLLALRDFELLDTDGRQLVGATSGWLVLDLQLRRPQRIEPIIETIRTMPKYRALGEEASKVAACADSSPPNSVDVKYSDLDLNDHVNNAIYARWILDSYPVEFHRAHRLREIALNYLAEVSGEDSVLLYGQSTGEDRMVHTIRRRIDGTEACRAEIIWARQ